MVSLVKELIKLLNNSIIEWNDYKKKLTQQVKESNYGTI